VTANNSNGIKIVVIGGGSGSSAVLRGLKKYTANLSAVVTMFDSGGSSGLLQSEFGYPPLGDLRQCLLGLSDDTEATHAIRELIGFRFSQKSSLNGHSLGNLLLAALTTLGQDIEVAIGEMSRLLRITGQVIPVSLQRADLCAELSDGRVVRGESKIDTRRQSHPRIERVFLDPAVQANPKAVQAILDADAVVLGPGDLYTSIIPNLLVDGIVQAVAASRATRIYVCNLMTKLGETDNFTASDLVRVMCRYAGAGHLDWALVNTCPVSQAARDAYLAQGSYPVVVDLDKVTQHVPAVFAAALSNNNVPLKHDSDLIAEAVLRIAGVGRAKGNGAVAGSANPWEPARVLAPDPGAQVA
jgi:uncharacterized cofD-like protein